MACAIALFPACEAREACGSVTAGLLAGASQTLCVLITRRWRGHFGPELLAWHLGGPITGQWSLPSCWWLCDQYKYLRRTRSFATCRCSLITLRN